MKDRLRRFWHRLLHSGTRPGQVALAVFIGCVVGATPFYGFHLVICIFFAQILGLNKLIVYGAANISFPPMGVAVAFGSVQLGTRLLYGHWLQVHYAEFKHRPMADVAKEFFFAWTLGGLALGAAIGLLLGGLIYLLLKLRRRTVADAAGVPVAFITNTPPDDMEREHAIEQAISRAARRYLTRSWPWYSCYAVMKYGLDPCYSEILRIVPPGARLVDLGCGLGMLPVALALYGGDRRSAGIEWDGSKVRAGSRVARGLPEIILSGGDARDVLIPPCDIITLVDLLHYFDAETQRALLARLVAALPPGGRLLIREHDHAPSFRSWWTRRIERISIRCGWNRSSSVHFRPIIEIIRELESLGLQVERHAVSGPFHPGNVLLNAVKA